MGHIIFIIVDVICAIASFVKLIEALDSSNPLYQSYPSFQTQDILGNAFAIVACLAIAIYTYKQYLKDREDG